MSGEEEALVVRCQLCGNRCARPSAGGVWVLEWRLGSGPLSETVTDSCGSICAALARVPSSPLPGSVRSLWEQRPGGRRHWWLTIDARTLAAQRHAWLEQVVGFALAARAAAPDVRVKVLEQLRALGLDEFARAHQRDELVERCLAIRPRVVEPSLLLSRLMGAVGEEAISLATAWRLRDAVMAIRFNEVARVAGLDTARAHALASVGHRTRRFVRELDGEAVEQLRRSVAVAAKRSERVVSAGPGRRS